LDGNCNIRLRALRHATQNSIDYKTVERISTCRPTSALSRFETMHPSVVINLSVSTCHREVEEDRSTFSFCTTSKNVTAWTQDSAAVFPERFIE